MSQGMETPTSGLIHLTRKLRDTQRSSEKKVNLVRDLHRWICNVRPKIPFLSLLNQQVISDKSFPGGAERYTEKKKRLPYLSNSSYSS